MYCKRKLNKIEVEFGKKFINWQNLLKFSLSGVIIGILLTPWLWNSPHYCQFLQWYWIGVIIVGVFTATKLWWLLITARNAGIK